MTDLIIVCGKSFNYYAYIKQLYSLDLMVNHSNDCVVAYITLFIELCMGKIKEKCTLSFIKHTFGLRVLY